MKAFISIAVTLLLIWALQTKFGDIPPVGKFLNPATGFWNNAESKHQNDEELHLDGLQGKVIIRFDERRIPHIFAENDHDLYYAEGYITARDRLWQMDIQTRAAAGRLSEVVGPKALEVDRYHRRMGMIYGAENCLKGMMKDPESKLLVEAYSDGVNSYIHHLKKRDYPIEFKLLDYAPEEWQPINCAYLLKNMSETLAGNSDAVGMTNDLKVFGIGTMNDLFPDQPFHDEPIIPAGTKWDFTPLPIPKPSASFIAQTSGMQSKEIIPGIGSNNWAVNGSRSANGYPILANDPHLNLTFPSIWYLVQLSSPTVNVYGASLPGAPGVVIGFNQNISWGVTNVDADVLDWYQVKFKDNSKNEYWYNNRWNKTTKKVEEIKIRGQKPLYDTVIYTHQGPVVYDNISQKPKEGHTDVPVGDALRWIAHDASDEFNALYLMNRGKNYKDYRRALTYFSAPAQNFIFADKDNDIAITPNGKFPLKFRDQGKYILDGSDPANDWQGWIPASQNPTVKNPPRGFVSSANQASTDSTYPYYLNWRFDLYDRGKRINDLLSAMKKATVDSFLVMQMDNYSMRAHDILPAMLKYIDPTKLDKEQAEAYDIVKNWDLHFAATSEGASIFNAWWLDFYHMVWDEFDRKDLPMHYPSYDRTEKLLLTDPGSKWFDIAGTPAKETCGDVLMKSFVESVNKLIKEHGLPGKNWQWGDVKNTHINHLANIPGFGTGKFFAGGTSSVIDALKDDNGPSWRMVVQLGPKVQGFGIFPGGESGNPGSYYYDDMFATWRDGKLDKLLFLGSANEESNRVKSTLTLSSK
ncbi:MAG: penicillin acylase family protein [Bacteroidetes bacterium]|nr:penicillin acylase family protein [Bacteroidota bacterium]